MEFLILCKCFELIFFVRFLKIRVGSRVFVAKCLLISGQKALVRVKR